ncbi:MAG TPA: GH92 family glycosyl hydrolase [Bacteroidales bacterium]|nr:GH92 family glycosyl hydrolase [Bacteroidales bacterium]
MKYLILTSLIVLFIESCTKTDPLKYVDPRIGNVGLILEPTRPTVQLPNQLIRMYPNRKDYLDDQITSFPLTLISHRNGEFFGIMPFTGDASDQWRIVSFWDQNEEITTPYYYSVLLQNYNTRVEFVPGIKSGFFRFTFPENQIKNIALLNMNKGNWQQLSDNAFSGIEMVEGMKAFVYAELNQKAKFSYDSASHRALLHLNSPGESTAEFRYAISFISSDQAKENLKNERTGSTFESMEKNARDAWSKALGKIIVKGGTEEQKRTFYTALYRSYERMVDVTEGSQYYSNYDKQIHKADRPFYVDDWIWDTYLALHPLRCILDPQLESEMINSYINMYVQSGWLPTFPVLWGDNPCMNGFHSTIMILDGWMKGVPAINIEKAYEAMKKNAMEATMLPWENGPACRLDFFYQKNGFYPALKPGEKETEPLVHSFEKRQAVAITLGHSYDDWALARVAEKLGKKEDQELFDSRSKYYRNLYNAGKGFFMPKDEKGEWIDIDPVFDGGMGGRDYYDENNGWTYLWQVQHDIPGLIELMGGEEKFIQRLDQLFREPLGRSKYEMWAKFPDFSGITGQFSMGNEPSFHIPYLYNFTSQPWKTQRRIRALLNNWFPDNIFGIPGDEDGGGMSAFVVFSSMGFYPVVPGIPVYTIGSPVFDEISLRLPDNKKFRIVAENNSEKNVYVQKAILNGKVLTGPWFTHAELMNGGELRLTMGPLPNKEWGNNTNLFKQLPGLRE